MNNIPSKFKNLKKIYLNLNKSNNILLSTTKSIVLSNNNNNSNRFYTTTNTTNVIKKPLSIGQPTFESHPNLLKKDEILKFIYKNEFKERRDKFMKQFKSGDVVVLFTGPEPMMSYDIPWSFRQNTNFLYFTGFNEPEAVLVMENISEDQHVSHLFVRERIAEKEKWDGPRCGGENVNRFFGIDYGYNLYKDTNKLNSLLSKGRNQSIFCNQAPWEELAKKLTILSSSPDLKLYNIEHLFQTSRLIKSDSEIQAMLKSGEIAGQSFAETMKYTKPNLNEYQVSAYFEWSIKDKGAQRMSYPPVVAGGNNGHTLHYIANNQILMDGELLLMDAGAEHWGYTSDITRTFPINGKFTDAQREIYEAVLDVNKQCIEMCKEGETINTIHMKSIELIQSHLLRLGILNSSNPNNYNLYYPHSIGHYLGMDTHDTLDFHYGITLQPNMIITIEPGIYISKYDTNVPPQYRGISIRIEDDVVISEKNKNPIVLTYKAPKEINEIESIMKK